MLLDMNEVARVRMRQLACEIERHLERDVLGLFGPIIPGVGKQRAREVATMLMEHQRWGTHARGISMQVLRDELRLRIDDLTKDPPLHALTRNYFALGVDFMLRNDIPQLTQSRDYL